MLKLPRTLHIEGSRLKPGQVDPDAVKFAKLMGEFLVVEEKVDGTGVSIHYDQGLKLFHRGTEIRGMSGEFGPLWHWAIRHLDDLYYTLEDRYVMFGEWMMQKHHIFYDQLPHLFLESDVYDQKNGIWLSTKAREALFKGNEFIRHVPVLDRGKFHTLNDLTSQIKRSRYQTEHWPSLLWQYCETRDIPLDKVMHHTDKSGLMEGLYIKHENDEQVLGRYKYVRYEFINDIINPGVHWKDLPPVENLLHGGWKYTPVLE
jgi:RNA ligase